MKALSIASIFILILVSTISASDEAEEVEENLFYLVRPLLEANDRVVSSDNNITLRARVVATNSVKAYISGVIRPHRDDLLLVYSPANSNPQKSSPVFIVKGDELGENYLKNGIAATVLDLFPLGSDFVLRFYKFDDSNYLHGAVSDVLQLKNNERPSGVHLAVTDKAGQMKVMWVTGSFSSQELRVKTENGLKSIVANHTTYTSSEMCGEPAKSWGWKDPGFLWEATVTGLTAGTKYEYIVGSDESGWTKHAKFYGPPRPSDSIVFSAIGDLGTSNNKGCKCENNPQDTVDNIIGDNPGLVIHVGDISYARGIASQWPRFLHQIHPLSSEIPWMTLAGNHERDWNDTGSIGGDDSGGECGVPFERRFKMPNTSHQKPWYSFEFGPVHFTFISTEVPFNTGSPQYKWFEADLASVNRTVTPWLVVSGHRPMYISSKNWKPDGDQIIGLELKKYLEPIMFQYSVDVAFFGHHHSYQRTCKVYKDECHPKGIVYLVVGNAGAHLSSNIQHPKPEIFKLVDNKRWGHTKVTVTPKTFKFEYFANGEDEASDSHTLKK